MGDMVKSNNMKTIQVWVNYFLNGDADTHDYDIKYIKTGDYSEFTINRSNNPDWVEPNEEVGSMVDDGNYVKINIGNNKIKVDYEQANQLLALLMAQTDSKIELRKYKNIKSCN